MSIPDVEWVCLRRSNRSNHRFLVPNFPYPVLVRYRLQLETRPQELGQDRHLSLMKDLAQLLSLHPQRARDQRTRTACADRLEKHVNNMRARMYCS